MSLTLIVFNLKPPWQQEYQYNQTLVWSRPVEPALQNYFMIGGVVEWRSMCDLAPPAPRPRRHQQMLGGDGGAG